MNKILKKLKNKNLLGFLFLLLILFLLRHLHLIFFLIVCMTLATFPPPTSTGMCFSYLFCCFLFVFTFLFLMQVLPWWLLIPNFLLLLLLPSAGNSKKPKNSINFILHSLFMTTHAMRSMCYPLTHKKGKNLNGTPPNCLLLCSPTSLICFLFRTFQWILICWKADDLCYSFFLNIIYYLYIPYSELKGSTT